MSLLGSIEYSFRYAQALKQLRSDVRHRPLVVVGDPLERGSKHRALVTPAKRGRGNKARGIEERPTPAERRASLARAQRLKRVFNIDIETCSACGGAMKVIACIEEPVVIKQILEHLKHKAESSRSRVLTENRAPPVGRQPELFD